MAWWKAVVFRLRVGISELLEACWFKIVLIAQNNAYDILMTEI